MTLIGTVGVEMRVGDEAFEITPFLEEFVWTESLIRGGFSWSLRFNTQVWDDWWDLLLGREQPTVEFRLRSQEHGAETTTEWKRAITDWSRAAFGQGQNMHAEIQGADRRLDLLQRARTRTFKESSVSEVVSRVARDHGLQFDVIETSGRRDRWQFREYDWAYLQRLVNNVAAADGRGDVFLWMDEETVRLLVVQSQAASSRRHDTAMVEDRLNRYVVQYHGREIDRRGGATLVGVGFDFATKKGIVFELGGQQARAHPALGRRVPRVQEDGRRIVPVIESDRALVEEATRSIWGDLSPRYFSLRVDTRADLTLRPNTVVDMIAADDADRVSAYRGRYLVLEIQHRYSDRAVESTVSAFRREAFEGEDQPTGAAADTARTDDSYTTEQRAQPKRVVLAEVLS